MKNFLYDLFIAASRSKLTLGLTLVCFIITLRHTLGKDKKNIHAPSGTRTLDPVYKRSRLALYTGRRQAFCSLRRDKNLSTYFFNPLGIFVVYNNVSRSCPCILYGSHAKVVCICVGTTVLLHYYTRQKIDFTVRITCFAGRSCSLMPDLGSVPTLQPYICNNEIRTRSLYMQNREKWMSLSILKTNTSSE